MKEKPTKIKMLSQKAYLKDCGQCPMCRSRDISGGPVEIDGKSCWQEINCGECNASWRDVYQLAGFENL